MTLSALMQRLRNPLTRNTLWMALGQGMRLLVQAAYFTLIARSLGAANYGAFVGVAAFVGIAAPFGALGSGNVLIRDVSRDPSIFPSAWGAALLRTAIFGSLLVGVVLVLSRFALPTELPRSLILLVAVADILGMNLALLFAYAFQALERLSWTSSIYVGISVSRLVAAILLVIFHPHPTALEWGYAYLASTLILLVAALFLTISKLGAPTFSLRAAREDLRQGLYFASGMSAQTVYNDLDKTMLARLSTLDATGIYGAAYRIVEVSFSPVNALLGAAYPRFFRAGADGIKAGLRFARPLMWKAFLFSSLLCVVLMMSAGLLPIVLGRQFASAAVALRWLALILPLRSIHSFLSDVLTTTGKQGLRTLIQITVAVLNGALNLWAIPMYSWRGAVFTSLLSDACLAAAVGVAVWMLARKGSNVGAEKLAGTPEVFG